MPQKKIRSFFASSKIFRRYVRKYKSYYLAGLASLVVVDLLNVIQPLIIMNVIDNIKSGAAVGKLGWLAGIYFAVAIAKSVGRYMWRISFAGGAFHSSADIRYGFFRHLTRLSGRFFNRSHSGDLISLATNDVESVRMMFGPGLLVLADALMYLAIVPVIMFTLSPRLSIYAFITLPVIPFLMAKMSTMVQKKWKDVQNEFSSVTANVHENISGIRVSKSFNIGDFEVERLARSSRKYMKKLISYAVVHSIYHPVLEFIFAIGIVVFVILGGLYTIRGGASLGTFVAFLSYIDMLTWPMVAIGWVTANYSRAVASNIRMEEVVNHDPEVKDLSKVRSSGAGGTVVEEGHIELRNLSFSYEKVPVLENIDLDIRAGTTLGIIGGVGSGKTTLVTIMPRLYEIPEGTIFIDGHDVRNYPPGELRRKIAVVPQDVFLFSESIRRNITFGVDSLSDEGVERLARLVEMHGEISSFSEGYKTMLGEKGVNLSGGQKQRLAIARALALEAPILILDDAFSSVDTEVEERILRNLKGVIEKKTTIIISHRISTLKYADRIVTLKDGKIFEDGSRSELMAKKGYFYNLFRLQKEVLQ